MFNERVLRFVNSVQHCVISKEIKMSTIVAVQKHGVVVIACDTLTKYGTTKESHDYIENHSKIIKVGDSFIGITGPTSTKIVLEDYFCDKNPDLYSVGSIFKEWVLLHQSLKDDYFLRPDEDEDDSYESSRMDVLIANTSGIFAVSSHRSVQKLKKFYAFGTGFEYAMGAMYTLYGLPEVSAEKVAQQGIEAAAEFDHSTGLPMLCHSVQTE